MCFDVGLHLPKFFVNVSCSEHDISLLSFVTDEEMGPNGRIKRRRKLSEKAAELQAEKGRKVSVKKPGPPPKLGKGELKGSPSMKGLVSNGSGGNSSITAKGKHHEPQELHEDADDEVNTFHYNPQVW